MNEAIILNQFRALGSFTGTWASEDEKDSGFVLGGGGVGRLTACTVNHVGFLFGVHATELQSLLLNKARCCSSVLVVGGAEGVAWKHADISVLLN